MLNTYHAISAALASIALMVAYALSPYPIVAGVLLGLGIIWQFGRFYVWKTYLEILFVAHVVAAAIGAKLGLSTGLTLLGVLGALSAWDLHHFAQRLHGTAKIKGKTKLIRQHLQRLSLALIVGVTCVLIALGIPLKLNLWIVIGLGLLAVWSLGQVSVYLKGD